MNILKKQIDKISSGEYENFDLNDYVQNPIALARIKAHLTRTELADCLEVFQADISKIEKQEKLSAKMIERVNSMLAVYLAKKNSLLNYLVISH